MKRVVVKVPLDWIGVPVEVPEEWTDEQIEHAAKASDEVSGYMRDRLEDTGFDRVDAIITDPEEVAQYGEPVRLDYDSFYWGLSHYEVEHLDEEEYQTAWHEFFAVLNPPKV